jgi:DNA-binding transcriptional MerR regulator
MGMSEPCGVLLTIGTFATRSRLTLKALRLYDEMGLLKPTAIDPKNGYRYYDEQQLDVARLIGLLRRLEMPLAQIAEVITLEGSAAVKSISAYWRNVEEDMETKRRLVRYLSAYLTRKGSEMFAIETRFVPDQSVASIEARVLVPDLPGFISESLGTLHDYLAQIGTETGIPFVVYHGEVNTDSDGPVEVCLPYIGSVEPIDEIRLRVEKSHQEAFTRLTKAQVVFPGILEAYQALEDWVSQTGTSAVSAPREIYFANWDSIGDDDPACDVALPVG